MRATLVLCNQNGADSGMLWNQNGADSGSILFGRMAASYMIVKA
jgi:hypothetical protein